MISEPENRRGGRLLATLPKLLLAGVLAAALPAQAAFGQVNTAVAVNHKDGSSIFNFAFKVHREMNRVIDETNIAVAFASCEGCQTVAIAIQIVLVMSDPNVVAPENAAVALNVECSSCETFAGAYQYVFSTGGSVRLTAEGTREILAIRRAFFELARRAESGELSLAEVQAEAEQLIGRLYSVVQNELVPTGRDGASNAGMPGDEGRVEEPTSEPKATPTSDQQVTSPSPSPTESPGQDNATGVSPEGQTGSTTAPTQAPSP